MHSAIVPSLDTGGQGNPVRRYSLLLKLSIDPSDSNIASRMAPCVDSLGISNDEKGQNVLLD